MAAITRSKSSVLTEETLEALAEKYALRLLPDDGIALNPAIHVRVEAFEPAKGFGPKKAYRSRIIWRDLDGERLSKLLLSEPQAVLAIAVRGEQPMAKEENAPATSRRRRGRHPASSPTLP